MTTDKTTKQKFKEARSKFLRDARIKECFHFDKSKCNGDIVQAHSLQKNGVLNIIESEVNGNNVIFSFLRPEIEDGLMFSGFEPLGRKQASTFHGFCKFHDSEVFRSIENTPIDIENDEHCFLLSYRAFAKEYHAKIETLKGYKTNDIFSKEKYRHIQQSLIRGTELAIKDYDPVKDSLMHC